MNQRLSSATRILPWLAVAAIGIAIGLMIAGGGFIRAAATEQTTPTRRDAGVLRFPEGAPQLAALRIEVAETFPLPLAEPLNGRVAYDENRTVRISAPIAGRVISIKSEVGDGVRAGDTLATIDAPELGAAAADLAKAHADDQRKAYAHERAKRLFDGEVLARKDLEVAEADLQQARAETARAGLRLQYLIGSQGLPQGQRLALRSAISGVVAERQLNPGMEVRPDLPNPLYVVTDPTRVWVYGDLPERHLAKVAVGQPVLVELDALPGRRFEGRVERIGIGLDPSTRRVQLRCSVANPDRLLRPEMYARVTVLADAEQRTVRVPNSALVAEGTTTRVFIERSPGVIEARRVTLAIQDPDHAYVAEGLRPGERVVVQGALLLNSELGAGI